MPYPDNYSPAAQDRFMGRNSRAEERIADSEQALVSLDLAHSALDDATVLVEDFGGDVECIQLAMNELERVARHHRRIVA